MESIVVEKTKDKISIEILGADHGIMNVLCSALDADKDVKFASYTMPHPLIGDKEAVKSGKKPPLESKLPISPDFVLNIHSKTPEASFKKALVKISKDAKEISAAFKKVK